MLYIGVLQFSENHSNKLYIERLAKENKLVELSGENIRIENECDKLQAVVIFENELNDVARICTAILSIKEQAACHIWIVSTIQQGTGKIIYLQLGVDSVFNEQYQETDEVGLSIENTLIKQQQNLSLKQHQNEKKYGQTLLRLKEGNLSIVVGEGDEVPLTRLEFKLIHILAEKPKTTFSYEEIHKKIYGDEVGNQKYRIANLIFHLRKKIEKYTDEIGYIKTVHSKGYMLVERK
ncbi:helix-turn-helix domain-containing protein [Candidatus Enterococcus mansonii]|uniref:OmpR/PhoB-type domain-containing protein n=1 Tax=Candidatus Enterococcus mansonii TaxID=1834181 RepID=A0A242CBZ2_9ENTE|nr:helix-turn-helix domain-containing protein [Enterococcus sp. 4G2_DIV0659]OTO07773.1 hypothetical protein A5880_002043 [Enterococcus sp. 4G2_DIV0659]